ncbi:MAG: hypothetical protein J0I12_17015 [Candidatus Eremiobacteraeota bacterium]|nr:hypothetical protein [Candidatus Eremiobacteraeota bacterium]
MFDVASGECELIDFLLTRFDPIDLKTKIKFDPRADVDEQLAAAKNEEAAPVVPEKPAPERVAVQLDLKMATLPSSAPEATDPNDGFRATAPAAAQPDDQDLLETSEEEEAEAVVEEPKAEPAPGTQDWLVLYHQRFQEAAQRYQEESGPTKNKENEAP